MGREGEEELHTVLMLGCISAAMKYGLHAPKVANGKQWTMRDHVAEFRKRAEGGDAAFPELLEGTGIGWAGD